MPTALDTTRIRARMRERGLTVEALAAKVSELRGRDYGRSCLSRTLSGKTNPGADVVQALAVALQLPADEVLGIETTRRVG